MRYYHKSREAYLKKRKLEIIEFLIEERQDMEEEPITCARFGCGKKLTLLEQLYGKYCFEHSGGKNIDVMMVLKLP